MLELDRKLIVLVHEKIFKHEIFNYKMKRLNKKGISPVIATVLLIVLVLVIALIIFLWFRGMTQEEITKFDKNIELVCEDVVFRASYSDSKLYITNDGNVPIHSIKLKLSSLGGEYELQDLADFEPLVAGKGGEYDKDLEGYSEVELLPVLLGNSDSGQKEFVCENHGVIISI